MFKILVAEDDAELRQLFCRVLTRHGFQPIGAADGVEALQVLERDYIDLIVSDIMMPQLDGYALDARLLAETGKLGLDPAALDRQLTMAGCDDRRELMYHKMLLNGELPLTIGGGIGQSRMSMLMLGKAHIGEVQASVWDEDTIEKCKAAGIMLL